MLLSAHQSESCLLQAISTNSFAITQGRTLCSSRHFQDHAHSSRLGTGPSDRMKQSGHSIQFATSTAQNSSVAELARSWLAHELPYDMVVKVPATETGLSAIKLMKKEGIQVLATAIYSAQQGFLAALCGADYLAPYVNRIDAMNGNGVEVVADLQLLLDQNQLPAKILAASFKNTQQAMEVMKLGIEAITLPVDVAAQMFSHPAVQPAVDQFDKDWKSTFGNKLSFES